MSQRKPKSRRYRQAYLQLNAAFPLAFPLNDADLRPLALSTREDVRAWIDSQSVDRWRARALLGVMQQHGYRLTYQQVVAAGGMRINLHGEPVEPVTADGQAHAKGRIAAIWAARLEAEARPAGPPQPPQAAPGPSKPKGAVTAKSAPPPAPLPSSPPKVMPTVIVKKCRTVVMPPKAD